MLPGVGPGRTYGAPRGACYGCCVGQAEAAASLTSALLSCLLRTAQQRSLAFHKAAARMAENVASVCLLGVARQFAENFTVALAVQLSRGTACPGQAWLARPSRGVHDAAERGPVKAVKSKRWCHALSLFASHPPLPTA